MTTATQLTATDGFSDVEQKFIASLTLRLTGSAPDNPSKLNACLANIKRRMLATESADLASYIARFDQSPEEFGHFISAVTIHTTSWFREAPHFDRLRNLATTAATAFQEGRRTEPFRLLSAGCSSGEEAYSMALVLEEIRQRQPRFDYRIEGWDVDPVSVAKARKAIYSGIALGDIPAAQRGGVLYGTGKTNGFFTLTADIRDRCHFRRRSLVEAGEPLAHSYDVIFCRNVLIYFNAKTVHDITSALLSCLVPGGHLCLGHSESMDASLFGLTALGNTTYKKPLATAKVDTAVAPVAVVPVPARLQGPMPTTLPPQVLRRPGIVVVGASTGGTEILIKCFQDLPRPFPPLVVVQHIAVSFAKSFAERLAQSAGLQLGVPSQGAVLQDNHLYMAWDDYHIGVRRRGNLYTLEIGRDPALHGVRPAVDYLFQSLGKSSNQTSTAAILLTGMGKDGARGLHDLRHLGAMTFVQDEASSTVFGMPREAIALGAAGFIGSPSAIRQQLLRALQMGE